jgi:hypothetical protein
MRPRTGKVETPTVTASRFEDYVALRITPAAGAPVDIVLLNPTEADELAQQITTLTGSHWRRRG